MENQSELEKIKKEILGEVSSSKKNKKKLNWGSAMVTGVLVVLTLFSVAQTVQSATILSKINSGAIKSTGTSASGSTPLPSSLQNLPNMVGGC